MGGEPETDRHAEPHPWIRGRGVRGEVDPGERSAHQSGAPPRIIVLTGFMGTGKSTVAVQFAIALAVFIAANGWLARNTRTAAPVEEENPIVSIP